MHACACPARHTILSFYCCLVCLRKVDLRNFVLSLSSPTFFFPIMFSNLRKRILALTDPSPSPSPFQCLPEHVAEIIAHYYCDLPERHSMFFRPKKGINEPWLVLRDVSSSWMALAFKHIYKEARLMFSSDTSENALVFTYLRRTTKGRAKFFPYAKEVNIVLKDMFDHSDQIRSMHSLAAGRLSMCFRMHLFWQSVWITTPPDRI